MKKSLTYLTLAAIASCTSPIEIEVIGTKEALVVEAAITSEVKPQEVRLTTSFCSIGSG
ncbi:MAG: DUF4249 family protein [Ekhidna sp.]|nr:DUF4249 family protein [Ekhidna sp.]